MQKQTAVDALHQITGTCNSLSHVHHMVFYMALRDVNLPFAMLYLVSGSSSREVDLHNRPPAHSRIRDHRDREFHALTNEREH